MTHACKLPSSAARQTVWADPAGPMARRRHPMSGTVTTGMWETRCAETPGSAAASTAGATTMRTTAGGRWGGGVGVGVVVGGQLMCWLQRACINLALSHAQECVRPPAAAQDACCASQLWPSQMGAYMHVRPPLCSPDVCVGGPCWPTNSPPPSNKFCGGGNTGNLTCADPAQCCSKYGWCWRDAPHCR